MPIEPFEQVATGLPPDRGEAFGALRPGGELLPGAVQLAALRLAERFGEAARGQNPVKILPVQDIEADIAAPAAPDPLHRRLIFAAPGVCERLRVMGKSLCGEGARHHPAYA